MRANLDEGLLLVPSEVAPSFPSLGTCALAPPPMIAVLSAPLPFACKQGDRAHVLDQVHKRQLLYPASFACLLRPSIAQCTVLYLQYFTYLGYELTHSHREGDGSIDQ